jgi:hypothetical protein
MRRHSLDTARSHVPRSVPSWAEHHRREGDDMRHRSDTTGAGSGAEDDFEWDDFAMGDFESGEDEVA